jgi:hypothetical protein
MHKRPVRDAFGQLILEVEVPSIRRFAFMLMSLGVVIFSIRPPWARAVIAARSANKPSAEHDVVPTGP